MQYLGTAAAEGWPALFCQCDACREAERLGGKNLRFRSGALINGSLLIDVPPDLYAAKLKLQLDLSLVHSILVTHAHLDHFDRETLAMFVEPYAHIAQRIPLRLYGSAFTASVWHEYMHDMIMREEDLEHEIEFRTVRPFETFDADTLRVTALPAVHSCKESLIYLIEKDGKRLLYANDTGLFAPEVWDYLNAHKQTPLDIVSLDSTMGWKESRYTGHMTLQQNVWTREKMLADGIACDRTQFICQHFSHNGGLLHAELERLMNPKGFDIAFDGKIVEA